MPLRRRFLQLQLSRSIAQTQEAGDALQDNEVLWLREVGRRLTMYLQILRVAYRFASEVYGYLRRRGAKGARPYFGNALRLLIS